MKNRRHLIKTHDYLKATMMKLSSKLPDLELTIFSVMTQLANEHGAINLSQGFPDFDTYPELISLVEKYMSEGHNQYAPMQGVMALRERIAEKVSDMYGAQYDPATEITVTSGATESVFAAIAAVVQKDDEVIIFEPAYDAYAPIVQLNGGIPVFLQLVVSDEAYEHIIFDGLQHESISRHPQLAQRSFVICSFGKTYHTTGWKIGYTLAPETLSIELQKIHQYLTFASNTPIQIAFAEFMKNKDLYLNLPGFYQQKRDLFLCLISDSRFTALPCKGTYYQMLDYSQISDEPEFDFAKRLTVEHGVAAIPPSALYHQKEDHRVLRFCFAKKPETLKSAAERLCRI
ncbi:MAG: aminotransferase class I/II-fold pyridoxal phosphate-dependent enzyme [Desulfobacterales bacterium]